MPQDTASHYREPHEAPRSSGGVEGPRQVLGRFSAPWIGDVDAELGLGRALRIEVDRELLVVQPGSGLVLRARDLPTVELRALQVDLVHGVVRSDADALGPFFDRALTVALCGVLRQTLGWRPGRSIAEHAARRIGEPLRADGLPVWARSDFPRATLGLDPATRVALELGGSDLELSFSRPALLRVLGVGLKVVMVRYVFARGTLELRSAGVGPVRRWLLAVLGFFLNRWLRRRLPAAMKVPGYDLFADEGRRTRLRELLRRLRGRASGTRETSETDGAGGASRGPGRASGTRETSDTDDEVLGVGAGVAPHAEAGAGAGDRAGLGGLVSRAKAAVLAALQGLRVSADDLPVVTRALFKVPLGPFNSLALCTDRGGPVTLIKVQDGLRIEAPLGVYVFADQLPELAELRVRRVIVATRERGQVNLDLQTDPPLGALLRVLLHRLIRAHVLPRVPVDRLREGGLLGSEDRAHHVLWRQSLGGARALELRTAAGAEVLLAHEDEALVLSAPEGLELAFEGLPLPAARLRRLAYDWEQGTIEADGAPPLGPFGQALLAQLLRVRVLPHAPRGLGLRAAPAPNLDPALAGRYSALLFDLKVPVLGRLQVRMDPNDALAVDLRRAEIEAHSKRGIVLVAVDMQLTLTVRAARYALAGRRLAVDARPEPGGYVEALGGRLIETLLLPQLHELLPMGQGAAEDAPWELAPQLRAALADRLGVAMRLSFPPGVVLTLHRLPDALEVGATAPLQVVPESPGLVAEFAVERLRWQPAGERVGLLTIPPAGPLAHELARRLFVALTPDRVTTELARRLALPPPSSPPLLRTHRPALLAVSLPVLGALALQADAHHALDVSLHREGAELRFGEGMVLRAEQPGIALTLRRVEVVFLPFSVRVDCMPVAGELEHHFLTHALRGLFARHMGLFWPTDRARRPEGEVLLALGVGRPWGPIELCVGPGGTLELHLDHEGLALESAAGLFIVGGALGWLPGFTLHRLAYDFADGSVQLRISGVGEPVEPREREPVGPMTATLVSHLLRVLLAPHLPTWTPRLGMRVLPPPPPLEPEPGRVTVWRAELPLGHARVELRMDAGDVLRLRASRDELAFESARGLQVEVPGLRLRVPVTRARYHLRSGEIELGGLGSLENALAEAVLRHGLTHIDARADDPEASTIADVLGRFPVDERGGHVLFADERVRVLLAADATIVAHIEADGLRVAADPGLRIDGVAGLDGLSAGLRYSFADAAFHLDIPRDGVFAGLLGREGEAVPDSLLRPLLPPAMRCPGYSLAADPDPSATLAALLRTVSRGRLARFTAS